MRKWTVLLSVVCILVVAFSGSVFAAQNEPPQVPKPIMKVLLERILPTSGKVTFAQGVVMITSSLDLNIDHIRFIKEPKASDYFTKVADDAPYASAFIIALHNGLDLPNDVDPKAQMTREQFAHYLMNGVHAKGEFPMIMMWVQIDDEKQIDSAFMSNIQAALLTKIADLDAAQKFHPKTKIHRKDAVQMVNNAKKFVRDVIENPGTPVQVDQDVAMTVEKVTDEINNVIVSWGTKPNTGYSIQIDRIDFDSAEGVASVYYSLHTPKEGMMYAEVITEPKAETYIAANYKPILKASGDAGSSSSSPGSHPIKIHPPKK